MRPHVARIIIFPRYTTLVGTTAVLTAPLDVREIGQALLVTWMGTGMGLTPAAVDLVVQGSSDLSVWHDIDTITPVAGTETVTEVALSLPWLRVKATVSGSDPAVSLWMTGDLVRRDGAGQGEAA